MGAYIMSLLSKENKISQKENKTKIIKLPEPKLDSKNSIEKTLLKRRSIRNYKSEPLALEQISQLLWAAQGITSQTGFRTAPSAGATYPLELYLVIGNVNKLDNGIYKYTPNEHKLIKVIDGDKRIDLWNAAWGQFAIKNAAAIIVFSAIYERTSSKYGNRSKRYVHVEVGHAAQNIYLQAVSLNLGTVVIGAFDDKSVKKVINAPIEESPLYIMPIGRK